MFRVTRSEVGAVTSLVSKSFSAVRVMSRSVMSVMGRVGTAVDEPGGF